MTRQTRDTTTREARSRVRGYENIRDLAPEMIPDGMDVLWVTETVLGQYQESGVSVRLNAGGYTPLTTEDIPSLKMKALKGRETEDTTIRVGGQILMGRPKEYAIEDAAAHAEETRGRLKAETNKFADGLRSAGAGQMQDKILVRREGASRQFPE